MNGKPFTPRQKMAVYFGLIMLGILTIWVFGMEDDSAFKSAIRHFIRAIVRAL